MLRELFLNYYENAPTREFDRTRIYFLLSYENTLFRLPRVIVSKCYHSMW